MVAKVGMLLLFLGVAFLLKLAADYGKFPVYLRLLSVGVGAMALMGLGLRLRRRRPLYALILQGGGIGIFYADIFAAYRLFHLIPAGFAFATMLLAIVLATLLAIQQKAKSLAVLATLCGYLVPILISTGSKNHVALFSYYMLLNLSVFAVAWFQTWRLLHVVGFAFTFGVGAVWGAGYYRPELFASVEPFLIGNFLCYFVISILYAIKKAEQRQAIVDGTLVFGTPLIAFVMQYALVKNMTYGVFASSFALGGLYLFTTKLLWKKYSESLRFFTETFLILGSVFVTLSVAFLLDRPTLAIFYAIEGAGLIFVGIRQKRLWSYLAGSFLIVIVSSVYYGVFAYPHSFQRLADTGWLSPLWLTQTVILACAFFAARQFFKSGDKTGFTGQFLAYVHLVYAGLFWLYFGLSQVDYYFADHPLAALIGFLALSLFVFEFLRTALRWPEIQGLIGVYPWLMAGVYIGAIFDGLLGQDWQSLVWIALFGAQYFYLWRSDALPLRGYKKFNHFVTAALLFLVVCAVATVLFGKILPRNAYYLQLFFWYPTISLLAVACIVIFKKPSWPFARHKAFYTKWILAPVLLIFWPVLFFMQFSYDGKELPLRYLPFLNPHDLNVIFFIFAMSAYRWFCRREGLQMRSPKIRWMAARAFYFTIFVWLNFVLIRSIHYWTDDIARYPADIGASRLVQTSLSIFWSLSALVIMLYATRRRLRYSWLVGAGLLAVVVLKLFFVDLSQVGHIARVISFLGSGGLFVLIGYLSPIPPSAENQERFA